MKQLKILLIISSITLLAACSTLMLQPANFAWPLETVLKIDDEGNVYLTSGKVWVYNPKGELIEEIEFSESPANVCFGGKKRNILFVTARKGVYTLKMNVKGVQ